MEKRIDPTNPDPGKAKRDTAGERRSRGALRSLRRKLGRAMWSDVNIKANVVPLEQ